MKETIVYIFRNSNPKYKSIEGVFHNLSKLIGLHLDTSVIELKYAGGSVRNMWFNLTSFKRKDDEIYHITGDVQYMGIVTGKRSVLTVHDVQSIVKGSFLKKLYMKLFWFWLPAMFVKRITVISEFTRTELENILPFFQYKIRTVYNPVNEVFKYTDYQFNQNKPRILLLGTKPNKNLERTFESLKGIHCELTIIGQLTEHQLQLIETLELDVTEAYNLSLKEVVAQYQSCDLLCFASTYEGFGMPIIEAQAMGRPVLTSNLGAMKEVSKDTAYLVDPYDISSIRTGIETLLADADLRQALIQKGLQNVTRFSAEAIAKNYMAIYRELTTETT